mgnify:CR=1 FL=1
MGNNQNQSISEEQMLQEILENTRKTKKYMQWQFYITIVLVVLPILALAFVIPMVLRSLGSVYGGLIQ